MALKPFFPGVLFIGFSHGAISRRFAEKRHSARDLSKTSRKSFLNLSRRPISPIKRGPDDSGPLLLVTQPRLAGEKPFPVDPVFQGRDCQQRENAEVAYD